MISTKSKKEWYVTNTNVRIKKGYIVIIKPIRVLDSQGE